MDGVRGVTGILLAAGSGLRFGGDKQMARVTGVPLLARAARVLLDARFEAPIVVLAAGRKEHRALLQGLPVRIVENAEAATGMASSLRAALDAAAPCDAVLVMVCDQPAVTPEHLRAMVAAWRAGAGSIVASGYGGTRGVPALFDPVYFAELRALRGDRGAGPLLAAHADTVAVVPLAGGELDIDTPADLARL